MVYLSLTSSGYQISWFLGGFFAHNGIIAIMPLITLIYLIGWCYRNGSYTGNDDISVTPTCLLDSHAQSTLFSYQLCTSSQKQDHSEMLTEPGCYEMSLLLNCCTMNIAVKQQRPCSHRRTVMEMLLI